MILMEVRQHHIVLTFQSGQTSLIIAHIIKPFSIIAPDNPYIRGQRFFRRFYITDPLIDINHIHIKNSLRPQLLYIMHYALCIVH